MGCSLSKFNKEMTGGDKKKKCKNSGQIRVKEKKTSEREPEKIDMENLEQLSRTWGFLAALVVKNLPANAET